MTLELTSHEVCLHFPIGLFGSETIFFFSFSNIIPDLKPSSVNVGEHEVVHVGM